MASACRLWQIRAARVIHDQMEKEIYFEDAAFEFLGRARACSSLLLSSRSNHQTQKRAAAARCRDDRHVGSFIKIPYYVSLLALARLDARSLHHDARAAPSCRQSIASAGAPAGSGCKARWAMTAALRTAIGESAWMSSLFGSGAHTAQQQIGATGFDVQLAVEQDLSENATSCLISIASPAICSRTTCTGRTRFGVTGLFFPELARERYGVRRFPSRCRFLSTITFRRQGVQRTLSRRIPARSISSATSEPICCAARSMPIAPSLHNQ
jgi:hypothetical protein